MMNIENTKKMNSMIKELTKSGMVSCFDQAIDTAQSLYQDAMPKEKEQKQEVKEQTQISSDNQPDALPQDILQRKIDYAIRQNNENIAVDMQKLYNELKEMKEHYHNEILRLRNIIDILKITSSNGQSVPSVKSNNENNANINKPKPVQKKLEVPKKEENPRSGDFSPDNVVLENYFYYGTK